MPPNEQPRERALLYTLGCLQSCELVRLQQFFFFKKLFAKHDSLFPLCVTRARFAHTWDDYCLSRKLSNTVSDMTDALHTAFVGTSHNQQI